MTNPHLALRAEQALVGALLHERLLLDEIAYLPPDRLTHPTYQAVYEQIARSRTAHPDLPSAHLPEFIAQRLDLPGVDAAYLRTLADGCPEPEDIAVYARMVQETHVRATLAAHAPRLAASAGPVRGVDDRLDHLDRLAQALTRQSRAAADSADPAPTITTRALDAHTRYEPPLDERARREELILADLLQHRGQVAEVETWLTPEIFAPGPRREIYETILTVAENGEPISELTVEWELSRRSATADPAATAPRPDEPAPAARHSTDTSTPDYLARLVVTAVVVGAAVDLGNQLFTEDLRASLAIDAVRTLTRNGQPNPTTTPSSASTVSPRQTVTLTQPDPQTSASAPLVQPPPQAAEPDQPKPRP
ncbi:MAG TPA: DnaB-like helicase N-terminal domain-containing protein [Actinocrinis sp.]|uniref:DnaB-like helicase N-terminal domain-containing protein n=1 Tax=Actinocrinis sp. TaxID=1920516 RepID=UPI002DDCFB9A|nr:DnaB-like helicase N-terminal domain-containing protein [Actinocrinis sp.]HEV2347916.1 DnaB-like helicase N-terminal domain-containing protein [Actinocrinis sp.]